MFIQEEEWATDANAFVADDNDEEKWTVRSVGFDVAAVGHVLSHSCLD